MANKTLTQLLSLVGLRYERNSTNNDADSTVRTSAINEAQREMAMILGDACWPLARIATVTWTVAAGYAQELDATIQSVLFVEDPITPGDYLPHRCNGVNGSNGKLQVILDRIPSTSIPVHYLIAPVDLSAGSDETWVPDIYVDALVLCACKILAETGGSTALRDNFALQFQNKMRFVSRDCWRRHRQRPETQQVQLDSSGWNDGTPEVGPFW